MLMRSGKVTVEYLRAKTLTTERGCHEWQGLRDASGYGRLDIDNKGRMAHRVAWELTNGPIPDGMLALHRCDNPSCINPAHLFIGTQKDNMQDMLTKRRHYVGRHSAKVTEEQIAEIRRRFKPRGPGANRAKLAAEYGLSVSQIRRIALSINWNPDVQTTQATHGAARGR
jgi:hypothetical protein